MKWLAVLLLVPMAVAQLPHPGDNVVHNPYTIESELAEIQSINPAFIEYLSRGTSEGGHTIWLMMFGAPDVPGLPVLYLDANHHGNEHLGMEAVLIFMRELAQWSTTAEGQAHLETVRVMVNPMVNPDGTLLNRRINMNHVDLNRNYPYNWGLYGTSGTPNPTGGTYRGPAEASEVETQINMENMATFLPRVYLSMHTGSHDIVLPWRAAEDGPIPDWGLYEAVLAHIENVSGLGYREPAGAGESISYGYGELGALSLIVEVDTTQNDLAFLNGVAPMLAEEVEIFWWTLHNFHDIGPRVVYENGSFVNRGLGAAYNLTYNNGVDMEVLPTLGPGNATHVPGIAGMYRYDHTIGPGFVHSTVAEIGSFQPASGQDVPFPTAVVLLGIVAMGVLLRKHRL